MLLYNIVSCYSMRNGRMGAPSFHPFPSSCNMSFAHHRRRPAAAAAAAAVGRYVRAITPPFCPLALDVRLNW